MTRMALLIVLLILLLAGPAGAANDFSGDPNCLAVYRFENGALTTDSQGTNTLTASASSPTADTVRYQQGAASADFERDSSQEFSIALASLGADWPGKSAGYRLTVTFFCRPESLATYGFTATGGSAASGWSILLVSNTVYIFVQATGGAISASHLTSLVADTWYFVAITLDGAQNPSPYKIYIYDLAAEAVHGTTVDASINRGPTTASTEAFAAGWTNGYGYFDGLLDELTVWNRALTTDEIDAIRTGTYAPPGPSVAEQWWQRRRHP